MRVPVVALLFLALATPLFAHSSTGSGSGGSGSDAECCRPRSKGFWHRQCLGIGELTPGRGGGKGPGVHPAFTEDELRSILRRADRRIGGRCAGACDALDEENHRTARGRALAQYAAFLLNAEAGFLRGCDRDGALGRRIERLLEQERWEEAAGACERVNLGRDVRACDGHHDDDDDGGHGGHGGNDDDDGEHQHRPGCGHDEDDASKGKGKAKDHGGSGHGDGKAKGKGKPKG